MNGGTATSVCLLSGGLDSSVALAMEAEHGRARLALTVDYGQRAAPAELRAAERIAGHFGVAHQCVVLSFFRGLDAGALLDPDAPLPEPTRAQLDAGDAGLKETALQVWVPNRNGVLLQVAAAFAEAQGLERVVVGFNREEAATFADNSEAFMEASTRALGFSTRNSVKVDSPTATLDKGEILAEGVRRGLPLEWLWPCYRDGERPCGRCESCQRLRRAADRAGVALP